MHEVADGEVLGAPLGVRDDGALAPDLPERQHRRPGRYAIAVQVLYAQVAGGEQLADVCEELEGVADVGVEEGVEAGWHGWWWW